MATLISIDRFGTRTCNRATSILRHQRTAYSTATAVWSSAAHRLDGPSSALSLQDSLSVSRLCGGGATTEQAASAGQQPRELRSDIAAICVACGAVERAARVPAAE